MIGNKDEAERCLKIALNYMEKGNYTQGKKLLLKAKRMSPDLDIQEHLDICEDQLKNSEQTKTGTGSRTDYTTNCNTSSKGANTVHERHKKYSGLIDKILKSNNYYDILGVPKDCTEEAIKSAYKQLAKLLHPDKNKEKGAEEAFKKVSKAFQHLINKEKRFQYDNNSEDDHNAAFHNARYHGEAVFTPEDFFRNLFGVNFTTCNARTYRSNMYNTNSRYTHNMNTNNTPTNNTNNNNNQRNYSLIQIFTFVVMFLIFFLSSHFEQPKSVYSLQKTTNFDTINYTTLNNIRFYTKRSFNYMYPRNSDSRFQIEFEVEYKFYEHECRILSQKMKSDYKRNQSQYKNKVKYKDVPESCIKLRTLEAQYNNYILSLRKRS